MILGADSLSLALTMMPSNCPSVLNTPPPLIPAIAWASTKILLRGHKVCLLQDHLRSLIFALCSAVSVSDNILPKATAPLGYCALSWGYPTVMAFSPATGAFQGLACFGAVFRIEHLKWCSRLHKIRVLCKRSLFNSLIVDNTQVKILRR